MSAQKRASEPFNEPTFYTGLEPFSEFAEVADPAHYVDAPDDWIVVLADIKGSTEAARAGRYKDVNLVGAACITAALNVSRDLAFRTLSAATARPCSSRRRCATALRMRFAARDALPGTGSASSFGSVWFRLGS